eukprot:339943_1
MVPNVRIPGMPEVFRLRAITTRHNVSSTRRSRIFILETASMEDMLQIPSIPGGTDATDSTQLHEITTRRDIVSFLTSFRNGNYSLMQLEFFNLQFVDILQIAS